MASHRFASEVIQTQDSYDEIFGEYVKRGWTDGLPIVPPSEERVGKFIDVMKGRADTVVAKELPPRRSQVTLEKVAINAVMAGCLPEYMPIVVTMVECITEPLFNIYGIDATTSPICVATLVNGPLGKELGLNASYGVFGPGFRANATIGRALALIQRNVGGRIPGEISKSCQGQPGRYTLCLREFEESSPWPPFHTTRGFKPQDNTVTTYGATSTLSFLDTSSKTGAALANTAAKSIDSLGTNTMRGGSGDSVGESMIVFNPVHADLLKQDGFTREKLQEYLVRNVRRRMTDWTPEDLEQSTRGEHPPLRDKEGWVYMHSRPEQFLIAVAGGPSGYHSTYLPGWHTISLSVTKPVRMHY